MRISTVPAIFLFSFAASAVLYYPTRDARLVFDFVDFIRSYQEHGARLYDEHTMVLSPYAVSRAAVVGMYNLFDFSALPWHLVSCFLFAAIVALLASVCGRLWNHAGYGNSAQLQWAFAALFVLAPYHTETIVWAGAFNYLVVGLCVAAGLYYALRYLERLQKSDLMWTAASLLAGCFAHEWGLFGLAAMVLLALHRGNWRKQNFRATAIIGTIAIACGALYFVNQYRSGALIAHYGADVHLNFQWRDITVAFWKYVLKIVLLSGFWPVSVQDSLYALMNKPVVTWGLLLVAAAMLLFALYRISYGKARGSVAWLFFLWFALFVFPVLNLYFPHWTPVMADRYCFLTAAFLIPACLTWLSVSQSLFRSALAVALACFTLALIKDLKSWNEAGMLLKELYTAVPEPEQSGVFSECARQLSWSVRFAIRFRKRLWCAPQRHEQNLANSFCGCGRL